MKKRISSMLLAIVMVVGLVPGFAVTASAADGTTWDGSTVATTYAGGTGTEADPYRIETAGQLIYLRNQVNNGNNYDGEYFRLDADLDMASRSFGDPIGYINSSYRSYYFNGHFDGNNHTISNLTINSTSGYTALFGNVGFGTNESVISNLTLAGVNITRTAANYGAAALIGQAKSVKIANCTIESGTVNGKGYYTAGFVAYIASGGSGLSMTNCINKATITSTGTDTSAYTAGICANVQSSNNITGCVNYGDVTSNKGYAGGISAYIKGASIEKCANYGDIKNNGSSAAGILSNSSNYSITNCFNQGDVSASNTAGGITDYLEISKTDKIKNCYNVGTVSITSTPNNNKYSDPITTTSTKKENKDHVINTYTLTASGSGATTKTAYEFKSGMVALLLQGAQSETIWGQGTDYPEFCDGTNPIPEPPAAVTGITLSEDNLILNVGDSTSLTATVTPDNAGNKNVSWSSSAPSVATVENGLVSAIAEGKAVITATAEDGGFNATCTVTVQTHAHAWNAYEAKCGTCDSTHYTHTDYEWTNGVCSVCGVIGGYCGYVNQERSVEWMLTSVDSGTTYTLTISGNGNMGEYIDYNDGVDAPWFAYGSKITTVVINNGVKDIGWGAFKHLVNLTDVSIPNSVTEIKRAAFLGTSSLTSISLPGSVTTIGQSAFKESGLTSISIPSGVTIIQEATFSGCTKLTSVTLPNSITEIKGNAFQQCSSLSQITLSTDLTTVGEYAFNQSGLISITIPSSVTGLGMHAFSGCTKLKTVTINGTNLTIAERAFQGDEALETLTVNNTGNVSIGNYAFMIDVAEDDDTNVDIGGGEIDGWQPEEGGSTETNPVSLSGSESTENDTFESQTIEKREDKLYSITLPETVTYATDYATSFKNRVRSVSIEKTATVDVDNSITLTPVFTPDTAFDKTITWTSSDAGVATVDSNGKVTGISVGNATITATSKYQLNGVCKSDSCTVNVVSHTHNWTYALKEGTTDTIEATCGNEDGYCPNTNGGSVTITKPAHDTYGDCKAADATTTGSLEGITTLPNIRYRKKSGEEWENATTAAPTDAGTYKASITVDTNITAYVEYTIEKAEATAPTGLTAVYGQTLANVSLPTGWSWKTPTDSVGDVGTQKHKASYAGDDNHKAASDVDVTVTVSQSGATMTASAEKNKYTYGETVKITVNGITPTGIAPSSLTTPTTNQVAIWNGDAQLTEPQAVTGSALTFDVTELTVGDYTLTAKFTGNENMAATSCNVSVSIEQAEPNVTAPTGLTATYGDTLADVTLPTADDGRWTWKNEETTSVGDAGTQSHKATFTPNDTTNYKAITVDVEVVVAKATIDSVTFSVTAPEAGKTPQSSVAGGTGYTAAIEWNTTDTKFGFNTAYTATVKLTADSNHKFADDISVDDWDKSADGNVLTFVKTFAKTRKAKLTELTGKPTNKTLTAYHANANSAIAELPTTVTYQTESGNVTVDIEWSCDNYNSEVNATNTFTWSVKDGELSNYDINNIDTTGSITVTNVDALPVTNSGNDTEITYADNPFDVSTMFTKDTNAGDASYAIADGGTGAGELNDSELTITKVGTIKIKLTTAANGAYAAGSATATLTVKKAYAAVTTVPAAKNLTYTGSAQALVTAGEATGGTMVYSLIKDGTYTEAIPTGTDAGKYTVWYYVIGDDNHFDSDKACVEVTIAKANSSSGGSGSTAYTITVEDSENGDVTANRKSASKGTTVTVTVTPDAGYTLETLSVTDKNGNAITLTDNGDGTYSFKMPASKVTVEATFMDDNTMLNFFVDVSAEDYYYDAVLWAVKNSITGGVGNNLFAPDASCTRAQIVTFLWRAAGSPEPKAASSFSDVSADAYYAKAVAWAVENSITGGIGNNLFAPDLTCTRAQAAAFLFRYAGANGMEAVTLQELVGGYTDAASVPSYALPAFNWALAKGIVNGYNGNLMPSNDCTRAQIVTMLYRLLGK